MSASPMSDSTRWYFRMMDLFEVSVDRQAVIDGLPALLMAAGLGAGSLPVRIEDSAVLVPAGLYDLFVRVIEAHGLDEEVQEAVDADYRRQEDELRAVAGELGFDPSALGNSVQDRLTGRR